MRALSYILLLFGFQFLFAQNHNLRYTFNEDKGTYIEGSVGAQFWLRYLDMNPGSEINGEPVSSDIDISIRRIRISVQSQITPKLYFYSSFGGNNINQKTEHNWRPSILDFQVEYSFSKSFALGIGKTGWEGLSRNTSRSCFSMMTLDAPLFSLVNVNKNDDLGRMMGIWSKGKIGHLDYVVALRKPELINSAPVEGVTDYAGGRSKVQSSIYAKYEFIGTEGNKTAYSGGVGSYLGKKKVLNIGAGALYQPKMTSRLINGTETYYDFKNWCIEVFYDTPLNTTKETAITFYGGYYHTDFGLDYIRNIGADGYTSGGTSFNGSGNSFPMNGTGDTFFVQFGYLLSKDLLGKETFRGQLQPNIAIQQSYFDALDEAVTVVDLGINCFFNGHSNKLTLGYQSRPIFQENTTGELKTNSRKGMLVCQYQIVIR